MKHVDISSKIISLQCSWLRKLYDENFHEWKIIPSHLISKYFGKSFKFHSCLSFDRKLLIKFPKFYKNILFQWSSSFFASSELPSCILSNFLWFNKHILIEKKSIFFRDFSDKGLNFVYQLFDNNGNVKSWSSIKEEFGFSNISNFKWQQLIYTLPPSWKKIIKETDNADNLLLPNHHLIKKNTLIGIEKLNSRQLYSLLVYTHPFTPTSQKYLNELLKTDSFDWKQIYLLPRLVTLDSYSRSFQYKILNNVLYLNKKLFKFRQLTSPLCSFCKLSDETVLHLFYEYNILLTLQNELVLLFGNKFTLFDLTLQAAFLDFVHVDSELLLIKNDLLLIFSIYIYNSRRSESLKIKSLIWEITKVKNIEEKVSLNNEKRHTIYKRK